MGRSVGGGASLGAGSVLLLAALVLLLPLRARGDVYIMSQTYTLDPVPDLEADFGPALTEEGLEGLLRLADPVDSCSSYSFSDFDTVWVALIARQQQFHPALNCTFDIKVRHAQEAGAAAAIVYDDEYESLIIMSKPKNHPDPLIPSVFVTEKAGMLMLKLMQLEGPDNVRVRITPVSAIAWLSMVMSAVLGLLALTVVFSTFYIMRSWSLWLSGAGGGQGAAAAGTGPGATAGAGAARPGNEGGGLPPHVLRALPVLIYESAPPSRQRSLPNSLRRHHASVACALDLDLPEGGTLHPGSGGGGAGKQAPDSAGGGGAEHPSGQLPEGEHLGGDGYSSNSSECDVALPPGVHAGETKRLCTVCLETYMEGEKLRMLPCHHRFHMACIDQWLSARRVCPMCKHDCSKPLPQLAGSQSARGGSPHHPDSAGPQQSSTTAAALSSSLSVRLAGVRRAFMSVSSGPVASRTAANAAATAASNNNNNSSNAPAGGLALALPVGVGAGGAHGTNVASGVIGALPGTGSGPHRRDAIRARIVRWMGLRPFQRHAVLSALAPTAIGAGHDETAAHLAEPLLAPDAAADQTDLEQGTLQQQQLATRQALPRQQQRPPLPRQQQAAAGGGGGGPSGLRAGSGSSAPIDIVQTHHAASGQASSGGAEAVRLNMSATSEISEVDGAPARGPAPARPAPGGRTAQPRPQPR